MGDPMAADKDKKGADDVKAELDELQKKYSGAQRTLNLLLQHFGVPNLEAALAHKWVDSASIQPEKSNARPTRDDKAFRDSVGDFDPDLFDRAVDDWHQKQTQTVVRGEFSKRDKEAEENDLEEALDGLAPHFFTQEADRETVSLLLREWARKANGGKPATSRELRQAGQTFQDFFERSSAAALAAKDNTAAGRVAGEAPNPPAGGPGARAQPDGDGKPARDYETPEDLEAALLAANIAGGSSGG